MQRQKVANERQRPGAAPADEQAVIIAKGRYVQPPQSHVAGHDGKDGPEENNFERGQVVQLLHAGIHARKQQGAQQHLAHAGGQLQFQTAGGMGAGVIIAQMCAGLGNEVRGALFRIIPYLLPLYV